MEHDDAAPPHGPRTWVRVELGTVERPELVRWSTCYAPETARGGRTGTGYVSYVLRTPDSVVLVDPVQPDAEGEAQLRTFIARMGPAPGTAPPTLPPLLTLLTNDMHERDAYWFRTELGAPVWAPAAGQ